MKPGYEKRSETAKWTPVATVEKWTAEQVQNAEKNGIPLSDIVPASIEKFEGNLLTTAGVTRIMSLLAGAGGQAADATHTLLGVGDTATAATTADTALGATAGSTHQYWMPMDATYPSVSGGVLTAKSTWASADGNFAWNEWGLQITSSAAAAGAAAGAGILLNHKIATMGTKASGSVWALTVTVTLS